jgi:DNA-binding beta-propeller fold protein YncE
VSLAHIGFVDLPPHSNRGGFDHAAVHRGTARLYVAHTANSALDVINCTDHRYLHSIPDLPAVAGVLVSEEHNLVFTSNRGGNTIGLVSAASGDLLGTVPVGVGPNGLAYDPSRSILLAANVGDPAIPGSHTVSIVDVKTKALLGHVPVLGRTRWAIFDAETEAFYVNIADPPQIAVIEAKLPDIVHRTLPIPVRGPHGLDLDPHTHCLFCACDGKALVTLDAETGRILSQIELGGGPDVIFFNAALEHLYAAIGDPGMIEVFETGTLRRVQVVQTERGAHTIAFDPTRNIVYAFLPETHRAAIYRDDC